MNKNNLLRYNLLLMTVSVNPSGVVPSLHLELLTSNPSGIADDGILGTSQVSVSAGSVDGARRNEFRRSVRLSEMRPDEAIRAVTPMHTRSDATAAVDNNSADSADATDRADDLTTGNNILGSSAALPQVSSIATVPHADQSAVSMPDSSTVAGSAFMSLVVVASDSTNGIPDALPAEEDTPADTATNVVVG